MVERQDVERMVITETGCGLLLLLPIATDQAISRTVVRKHRFGCTLEFRNDALGQRLAQLDTPLIEGVDTPDSTLRENAVLVQCDKFPERFRRELIRDDCIGRMVTLEYAVRHKPIRHALRFRLLGSLAECQRFGLSQNIGDEHVVMAAERIGRLREGDKVTRNEPGSLMDQLIEGVLSVRPRFAPVDRTSVKGYFLPIESHVFAVALHGQLLQICWKALQILFVREDSN